MALKLAWCLCREAAGGEPTGDLRRHLDDCGVLAALGTVADVVPLEGENRYLVRRGL